MTPVSSPSLLVAGAVGLLAGTHAAIWGMYKDAIHEGFTIRCFTRSMIVGVSVAVALQIVFGFALPRPAALVVLFGLAYAAERGGVEVWKTFVREQDQSKYFIPMQFSLRGVPVAGRAARLAAGAGYVAAVALYLWAVARLDHTSLPVPRAAATALAGFGVGTIVAIGGAWKDAPKEGFEPLKFFRSPVMTMAYALLLAQLTDSHFLAAVAALGYERASIETYKTFFFPSKPRGKFAGKPIAYPAMLTRRQYFTPVYVAIWAAVIASGVVALRETARSDAAMISSGGKARL